MEHVLRASLQQGLPIMIIYISGDRITERVVTVHGITDNSIRAYCHLRKGPRIFKLDKILAADFCRNGRTA